VGLLYVGLAFVRGIRPLGDNSFLTHLATGRLILDSGIPRRDPYSFTAQGEPWVVQSWLASLLYGVVDELGGLGGLRVLTAVSYAVLAALVWRLTRPADAVLVRLGVAAFPLLIGFSTWSPRPLLLGLICFTLTLLIVVEDRDPRLLVPVMWVWVNTHGSFPLGLVLIAALAIGTRLDRLSPRACLQALAWSAGGTMLGALNPLGPTLLLFPLDLLDNQDVLRRVAEWASPSFAASWARLFLVQVVVTILALVRRPTYRDAVPVVVFLAAGLLATRNVAMASIVLALASGHGLAGIGGRLGRERSPATAVAAIAVAVVVAFVALQALDEPDLDDGAYPVAAIDALEAAGLRDPEVRWAHQDVTGNYLTFRYGRDARVFFDDRYDMFPEAVSRDYLVLNDGEPGWDEALDRHGIDVVVWRREEPLAQLLEADDRWAVWWEDDDTVVACRTSASWCDEQG
jgi:hypothetical protein